MTDIINSSGTIDSSSGTAMDEFIAYPGRSTFLGDLPIIRCLPLRGRRMVGPWCFLDRFGPISFSNGKPMFVTPHPHIGLQTITYLLVGEVLHTDSLGSQALLKPGGVNVMTAGHAIAHAEETPETNSGVLNGVQLWTALPDNHRHMNPNFFHTYQVPFVGIENAEVHVFAGTYAERTCPAPYYSPILGLDVAIHPHSTFELTLQPEFEHAVMLLEGDCTHNGTALDDKSLYFLGKNRKSITVSSQKGSHLLVIGGLPFEENILMLWNFVARTQDEIAEARADWEAHLRFGEVPGDHGQRLRAPSLLRLSQPNPAS